jgi:type II secretory pathway pseudopilin PulG
MMTLARRRSPAMSRSRRDCAIVPAAFRRPGTTLVELVVGLTITGLLTAAGYATFTSIIDHRERVRETTQVTADAASVRSLLNSWLATALILADSVAVPSFNMPGLGEADDRIRFVTTAATPLGLNETVVLLYIDRDPDSVTDGLVAELRPSGAVPVATTAADGTAILPRVFEIDPQVRGLAVEYLDRTTRMWLPAASAAIQQSLAVRITLSGSLQDTIPALLQLPFEIRRSNQR